MLQAKYMFFYITEYNCIIYVWVDCTLMWALVFKLKCNICVELS